MTTEINTVGKSRFTAIKKLPDNLSSGRTIKKAMTKFMTSTVVSKKTIASFHDVSYPNLRLNRNMSIEIKFATAMI